jgi:pyruvate kinase
MKISKNTNTTDKKTKILATLGPASCEIDILQDLLRVGANSFRLNCSHAPMEQLAPLVQKIRSASEKAQIPCSIVIDLQGPRLRIGSLKDRKPIMLEQGNRIRITTRTIQGTATEISTDFKKLPNSVSRDSKILLDDGSKVLRVLKTGTDFVDCEVVTGGSLGEHKGMNLPGADIDLPALTPKDIQDLKVGLRMGISHVALSFVRRASDIAIARRLIEKAKSHMSVIAKIEHPLAIANLDQILTAADGIMVARGDLAVELSPAEVPSLQKQMVHKANEMGKTCIVATQMLESMILKSTPTRAEASDVANAIYDGADVVMLSAETAVGQYPLEAVSIMSEIIKKAEESPFQYKNIPRGMTDSHKTGFSSSLARAAHDACDVTGADAVIVYTMTGWSAKVMSKFRPNAPIYALTPLKSTFNQLALYWGITPFICPLGSSTDQMLGYGEKILLQKGFIKKGQTVLITAGGTAKHKASNMLKIMVVGSQTYR